MIRALLFSCFFFTQVFSWDGFECGSPNFPFHLGPFSQCPTPPLEIVHSSFANVEISQPNAVCLFLFFSSISLVIPPPFSPPVLYLTPSIAQEIPEPLFFPRKFCTRLDLVMVSLHLHQVQPPCRSATTNPPQFHGKMPGRHPNPTPSFPSVNCA